MIPVRRVVATLAALALALPATLMMSVLRASAAVPVLVIDGKGWGHGVGMAQDGAYWMAKGGANLPQILGHFYPGTSLATGTGTVRVAVRASEPDAVIAFPSGGEIRDAMSGQQSPGFPVKVPAGGQVRIRFDGSRYTVSGGSPTGTAASASSASSGGEVALRTQLIASQRDQVVPSDSSTTITLPGTDPSTTTSTTSPPPTFPGGGGSTTTTTSPAPTVPSTPSSPDPSTSTTTTTAPPGAPPPAAPAGSNDIGSTRPLWAVPATNAVAAVPERGRQYRGVLEAMADGTNVRLVNQLDVEGYLKGMGEVRDPSWPLAALQTQAVAARTYALRAMAAGGEICDDDRCQVYLGAQAEYAAMNKAVDSTAKKVVAFGKALASTVYSANAGGFTATPLEGFGKDAGYPYLQASPYTTSDPMPWSVRVALTDLAARFGYAGTLTDVKIGHIGPSGRALDVELDGSSGSQLVPGLKFASGLGLRSTLFAVHIESADTAPPPPAAADLIQAPPDQAAQLAAAPAAPATGPVPAASGDVDAGVALDLRPKVGSAQTAGPATLLYILVLTLLTGAAVVLTPQGRKLVAPLVARLRRPHNDEADG